MKPVTDPELLRALNGGDDEAPAAKLKPVTDPGLLQRLNGKAGALPTKADAEGEMLALVNGGAFGFGDEIAGIGGAAENLLLRAMPAALMTPERQALRNRSVSEAYTAARDEARGVEKRYAAQNPGRNVAVQAIGGLAVPVPGGKLVEAATQGISNPLVRAVANIAGQGAIAGGLGGAGSAGSIAEAPGATLRGAAGGAVAAPLVAAGAGGVGGVVNNVRARLSGGAAEDMALRRVAEAIARDETTTQRMGARLDKLGPRAVVADAGGQNVRNLTDLMATLPGETANAAEQLIRRRQAGRGPALVGSAEQAMDMQGQRLAPSVEEWITLRASDSKPYYDKLRQMPIRADSELRQFIAAADELGATATARKIAAADRQPFSLDGGSPQWSMADLDRVKQGLDAQISASMSSTGQATPLTRALQGLKADFVKKLDGMTDGLYAEARRVYAGPSAMAEAAQLGRKVMSMDDASIRQATAGLEGSELQAFQLGAFEALRAKLGTEAGQTSVLKMWKEPNTRERLQAIFPTERAFREFASTVAAEGRLKGLESIGRGSQTARRSMGADDFNAANATDAVDVATGMGTNPLRALAKARELYGKASTPEPVRNAIGRLLLTERQLAGPQLNSIEQIAAEVAAQRSRQAQASATSGLAGLRALLGQ